MATRDRLSEENFLVVSNPQVETHTRTEIRATVGEVPYTEEDRRKTVSA